MTLAPPDVSEDFGKLIRTLRTSFSGQPFDYWDDLVMGIYNNGNNDKLDAYFKKIRWVHLDKPYPTCPELESDWMMIKGTFVKRVPGTTTKYTVDEREIEQSSLREYANDTKMPILVG